MKKLMNFLTKRSIVNDLIELCDVNNRERNAVIPSAPLPPETSEIANHVRVRIASGVNPMRRNSGVVTAIRRNSIGPYNNPRRHSNATASSHNLHITNNSRRSSNASAGSFNSRRASNISLGGHTSGGSSRRSSHGAVGAHIANLAVENLRIQCNASPSGSSANNQVRSLRRLSNASVGSNHNHIENNISSQSNSSTESLNHQFEHPGATSSGYSLAVPTIKMTLRKNSKEQRRLSREMQRRKISRKQSKFTFSRPECPICFEMFKSNSKIYQCDEGHIYCEDCKSKMKKLECPQCRIPLSNKGLRNRFIESILSGNPH